MSQVLVIGGGPCGLGAAWRLATAGHDDWLLLEQAVSVGGLAASVVDGQGFTWDLGGHVVFSHYELFDRLLDDLLADRWLHHQREAWVWMRGRLIPYPLQNNLWRLPADDRVRCLEGLENRPSSPPPPGHFGEWIDASFGAGMADVFMTPYNRKVWGFEPSELAAGWVGDRVATVDLERVRANVAARRDHVGWGPNATFRFPERGGTGAIWRALADRLPADRLRLGAVVVGIDPYERVVRTADGRVHRYDRLVSTMPLDRLLRMLDGTPALTAAADRLRWSASHIIGLGLGGQPPPDLATACWLYFPEDEPPCYRATVFSNYAPANVPHPARQWSLMCEVSESPEKPVDARTVVRDVEDGLRAQGLVAPEHRTLSRWHRRLPYGYPTPFLGRDALLDEVQPALERLGIHSRGRFGGWKYEVSNQDHAFMQGVEVVDHVLDGRPEVTYRQPAVVNGR